MKFRRIGCGLLVIVLSLPLAAPVTSHAAARFSDTAGHWAQDYIYTAVSEGIIAGYPDGRFRPDRAVTRAEFCSMVNKALGNNGTANITFRDVDHSNWYYSDVAKALAAAYTAGYDDNTFRPDNAITRQEAAVMLERIVPAYGKSGNLRAFHDYGRIADWAYESLQKINGKGYIGAYDDGRIHPEDQLTRAQTAKIICEIIDHETIVKSNISVDEDCDRLSDKIYSNTVTIDEDLGEDGASIENCMILGSLSVKGGGTDSVTVSNSRVASANVNKEDDSVRLIAKGETTIVRLSASKSCILQTSGLKGGLFGQGFSNITVNSSAEVTLRGSFPRVTAVGARAWIDLDSGSIDNLAVDGKYSDITAESGTSIDTATVNAESYFHGGGTISMMYVNADDVTYETKPKHWTVRNGVDTPSKSGGVSDGIAFSPKNGSTGVKLDAGITITFDSPVEMHDGDSISDSDIEDFIELRKGSSSGSLVDFSASISSSKKIITIAPNHRLSGDTKYYLIVEGDSIRDEDGDRIGRQTVSFTTGDDAHSVTTSYNPSDGAASVPMNPNITITFSEDVVRYSNGASIGSGDTYLRDCIVFRKNNSSGERVSFAASIDSSKKVITIYPSASLALNQRYYLAVVSNTLKTKDDGETVPSSAVSWTTGYTAPLLNNFSVTPGDTSISATATPNVAGRIYAVVLPSGSAAPSAAQIAVGQNSGGAPALAYSKNENAAASAAVTLPAMGGLGSGVAYDAWATLYSTASGSYSVPVKQTFTTTMPRITLNSLTVRPIIGGAAGESKISFSPTSYNYSVGLNSSITGIEIKAEGDPTALITVTGSGVGTVFGTGILTATADIASNPVLTVTVTSPGKTSSSYTITLNAVNDTSLKELVIGGVAQTLGGSGFSYPLPNATAFGLLIEITANDPHAVITTPIGANVTVNTVNNVPGTASFFLSIPEGHYPVAIEFNVVSGSLAAPAYTVTFTRPR